MNQCESRRESEYDGTCLLCLPDIAPGPFRNPALVLEACSQRTPLPNCERPQLSVKFSCFRRENNDTSIAQQQAQDPTRNPCCRTICPLAEIDRPPPAGMCKMGSQGLHRNRPLQPGLSRSATHEAGRRAGSGATMSIAGAFFATRIVSRMAPIRLVPRPVSDTQRRSRAMK